MCACARLCLFVRVCARVRGGFRYSCVRARALRTILSSAYPPPRASEGSRTLTRCCGSSLTRSMRRTRWFAHAARVGVPAGFVSNFAYADLRRRAARSDRSECGGRSSGSGGGSSGSGGGRSATARSAAALSVCVYVCVCVFVCVCSLCRKTMSQCVSLRVCSSAHVRIVFWACVNLNTLRFCVDC
jgi:hypothetical protein